MSNNPVLTILTFLPALFALLLAFLPKDNKKLLQQATMAGTLITLLVSLGICAQYHPAEQTTLHPFQLEHKFAWIPSLHINYYLGMDGISLLMVLMTTGIFPFVVGISGREIDQRVQQYYAWILVMETAILGVFLSLNLVLYYVFWEAMLIPLYFIIGIWGGPKRLYATVKFFLYTMVGSMVMLVSILALYFVSGQQTFDFPELQRIVPQALAQKTTTEALLFLGFFLAFGIKAPIWPFHTWVPDAYAEAPTGGTIILVALKMGLYGFLRFCLPMFPHAVAAYAPAIIVFSVIGIIYAALVAAMQTDLKRLIAYSSVSHIGVIMLAIFALAPIGESGAVIQMVSHTFTTGGLFLLIAYLYSRRGSYQIADYGGVMKVMPAFAVVFLIATLSSVALPLTSGFTGEFLMLLGAFQTNPVATGFATTAAIWSAVYMLWMYQRVMHGPLDKDENKSLKDLTPGEWGAMVPIVLIIFALGIASTPVLNVLNPSVATVLTQTGIPYNDPLLKPDTHVSLPKATAETRAAHVASAATGGR